MAEKVASIYCELGVYKVSYLDGDTIISHREYPGLRPAAVCATVIRTVKELTGKTYAYNIDEPSMKIVEVFAD